MTNIKLYSWLCFNTKGNLRNFSSGFRSVEAKRLMFCDIKAGFIVMSINSLSFLPSKYIGDYYWKMSKNNDLADITNLLSK